MQESRNITQKSASNLALAFILLPKPKRDGMSALYAFCREVDDVADEESVPAEERRAQLIGWRDDVRRACGGGAPQFAVNRELQTIIRAHPGLTFELFDDLIRGVEMDLDIQRYPTHTELEQYCYRVASVVGLLSIEIFGYTNPRARDYAVHLGKALQLTNILRDVKTDAGRGRIYLPLEELARFRVTESEILSGEYSPRFRELAASIAERAKHFYRLARETLPREDRRSMAAAELMGSVYWRLLEKLEAREFNVFGPEPTRVSKPQKILLILRTWLRLASGNVVPNYMARPDARRRLIVNADDFGRSASINEAVIRAHREGILTTASLMVNEPACVEAVALAKENPTLGVGLHLALLHGRSALTPKDIPGLVNERGEFSNNPVAAGMKFFFRRELRARIEAELAEQFNRFHATGLKLDHVNGHLHIHLHPVVFEILKRRASEWRITHFRFTSDPFWLNARLAGGAWLYRASHAVIYRLLSARVRRALEERGIRFTAHVFGLLQNAHVDERFVTRLLSQLPVGDSELYSHPSLDEFRHEFEALVSPAVRRLVRDQNIELIRYQDL